MGSIPLAVLHVDTEYGWRGGQQQLAYLATTLDKQGITSAVACQPASSMEQYCRENKLNYYTVRMHGEWDLLAGLQIARLCRQKGFTLLHLHCGHSVTLGLWAKLFASKLKLVATRRVDFQLNHRYFSRLKYANRLLNKIVCVSDEIRRIMLSAGIDENRLTTIHSGVDLSKYAHIRPPDDFRQQWSIPSDAFIVGTIAAMVGHKDYPTLLNAAKLVLEKNPKIFFCAVGDGPLEPEIRALAAKLNLGSRFIFAGYRTDVGNFLKSFDLFVLASNQEGLGTSILDAQAAGIPVVACASGGIPEMIIDGETGRLVPKENPAALSKAIFDLYDNDHKRLQLALAAQNSVVDFSIEKTVQRNVALYHSLLQGTECQNS
jgi:glycosyltransferase involved in cell wall biosynthesis